MLNWWRSRQLEAIGGNQAAARRSTARLRAHQAWSWKFPRLLNWMTRSVLLRLPDRPVLSEHLNKAACPLGRVPVAGNQQKQQRLEQTSKRWRNPICLGSSWFSPLVGELWLRVSLKRSRPVDLQNRPLALIGVNARSRSSQSKRLYHSNRKVSPI